ncbi:MAG: hypothetical protein II981_04625 [Bacteroidales bacterium]|nr:hypothetical protein [Bacteroidales bacterium]
MNVLLCSWRSIRLERWKEYFSEYKDKYVLIGGAACNLLEEELDSMTLIIYFV